MPSGYGRHSLIFAEHGYHVIAIDLDEGALDAIQQSTASVNSNRQITCILANSDFNLPLAPETISVAIVVHFVSPCLVESLSHIIQPGGYLIYQTYGANGQNWLTLPRPGQLAAALYAKFQLVYYKETRVGPEKAAVTVRCLARRKGRDLSNSVPHQSPIAASGSSLARSSGEVCLHRPFTLEGDNPFPLIWKNTLSTSPRNHPCLLYPRPPCYCDRGRLWLTAREPGDTLPQTVRPTSLLQSRGCWTEEKRWQAM